MPHLHTEKILKPIGQFVISAVSSSEGMMNKSGQLLHWVSLEVNIGAVSKPHVPLDSN